MKLIIATKNRGKLREIKKILKDLKFRIVSLNELDKKFRIVENGETFKENASKKALAVSKFYKGVFVVGEDSGLRVEYLKGAPGVYSKRYSGKNSTDHMNNFKLLKELESLVVKKRKATFCCCLALAKDSKIIKIFSGNLRGRISQEIKGNNGFGYDPIFYLPPHKKTVAQLPISAKNKFSHRAKAFNKLKAYLSAAA